MTSALRAYRVHVQDASGARWIFPCMAECVEHAREQAMNERMVKDVLDVETVCEDTLDGWHRWGCLFHVGRCEACGAMQ